MSIVRVERRNKFTVIPNDAARDSRLSYRARGVLTDLLSRPDSWSCRTEYLVANGKEGRDAVRTALRELETVGYLERTKEQNDLGQWITVTVIRDHAEGATEDGFPGAGHPDVGEPGALGTTQQERPNSNRRTTTSTTSGSGSHRRSASRRRPESDDDFADPVDRVFPKEPEVDLPTRKRTSGKDTVVGLTMYYRSRIATAGFGSAGNYHDKAIGACVSRLKRAGVSPATIRDMVDAFVGDPDLFNAGDSRWKAFILNVGVLQNRVEQTAGADAVTETRVSGVPAALLAEIMAEVG